MQGVAKMGCHLHLVKKRRIHIFHHLPPVLTGLLEMLEFSILGFFLRF